jgi:hypothetical protein
MSPDATTPVSHTNLPTGQSPPPSGPTYASGHSASARKWLSILLSLYLAMFLVDAGVSLAGDSLNLLFGFKLLMSLSVLTSIAALLLAVLIYVLMGLTPIIPKPLFLPATLFWLVGTLAPMPFAIYGLSRARLVVLATECCQCVLGIWILRRLQGGLKLRWPLVPIERLGERVFSWTNLCKFAAANVFLLLPAVLAYLFLCVSTAVGHFSDGFVALHPGGITVQSRIYVRNDGKTIQLFPMVHVADADFYKTVSQSFPANSAVLMEGVTDEKHLLTNGISYKQVASSLGLSEQQTEFVPSTNEVVDADVDVDQFSSASVDCLNLINGQISQPNPRNLGKLVQLMSTQGFTNQLIDDLLTKRNEHIVQEIRSHLAHSDSIMVPWGAANMPGISRAIEQSGFRLSGTKEYSLIRFIGRRE